MLSVLILALFIYGTGWNSFFPSLRLLQDTQWDLSGWAPIWSVRFLSFLWLVPMGLGFLGWAKGLRKLFFNEIEPEAALLMGWALALSFFSLFVLGLAVNDIFYWPLTLLFFFPMIASGLREVLEGIPKFKNRVMGLGMLIALGFPILLWFFEYCSPPLIWDAVLDHFRFAEEVSRLHQIPFHWTNHTGDMPKFSEMILAGCWNLGGEALSKISSSAAAVLMAWLLLLLCRESEGEYSLRAWIFWTCPFFLAVFAWGYAEGFLVLYEMLALFCFWKALSRPGTRVWLCAAMFFLGVAFSIKFTAVFAIGAFAAIFLYEKGIKKNSLVLDLRCFLLFLFPVLPWLLKSHLAYGNPFYPLAGSLFGGSGGYSAEMQAGLWRDTGLTQGGGLADFGRLFWTVFFTPANSVGALWTPLALMSLPWIGKPRKTRWGIFLLIFTAVFFTGWFMFCSNLRHAAGGLMAVIILSSLAWDGAFAEKRASAKILFGLGAVVSIWLCLSAQWTATAPYASALGLENPLARLKRNYSMSGDTYAAYRVIENNSEPGDKAMAFGVFQTYPLRRMSYVDFFWKKPIFLQWAGSAGTAQGLAKRLKENGVDWFIYQKGEAVNASFREKDFSLEGMPEKEYARFWQYYADLVWSGDNSVVYRFREKPREKIGPLLQLPGLQESFLGKSIRLSAKGDFGGALEICSELTRRYPDLAEGWVWKSQMEQNLGKLDQASASAKRAIDLGALESGLCDIMATNLKRKGQTGTADWEEKGKAVRGGIALSVDEALKDY